MSSIDLKEEIPFPTQVYIIWGLQLPLKDDEGRHALLGFLGNFLCIITILRGKISQKNTFTKCVLSTTELYCQLNVIMQYPLVANMFKCITQVNNSI